MKTASPALQAFLAAASEVPGDMNVFVVDLYTFTLNTGAVLRFCSFDQPVTVGGFTYGVLSPSNANEPAVQRSAINSTVGLSVDDLTVSLYCTPSAQVNGTEILAALIRGDFDGAKVLVQRIIMPALGDVSLGPFKMFAGTVGPVSDVGRTGAKITVKAYTELLNINMPRSLYQPGCINTLYDPGCTLSKAAFTSSGIVLSALMHAA